jgi:hypothetical protein
MAPLFKDREMYIESARFKSLALLPTLKTLAHAKKKSERTSA